jgi:hypothetical protein
MVIPQSKLSKTAYQMADPDIWLTGNYKGLDPVFLGRLAYYAKWCFEKGLTKSKQMKINTGIRTDAFQLVLYNEAQTYKKTGKLGKYKVKNAAKPGTSYHGEHIMLAVDVDKTHPFYKASNADLAPFGLCKPLFSIGEVWHGQPIETSKLGADASSLKVKALVPVDLALLLKEKFGLADATVTYMAAYKYAADLAEGLLIGKKDFSAETMKYLYSYKYWESLREKLGM